jgi:Ca-activated chloride channel homolog
MVYLLYPYLFWILIIPFLLFAFLVITNKSKIDRVFDPEILDKLRVDKDSMPLAARNILFLIALFLMIVAMARPVVIDNKKISSDGANIVLALDISGSMRSTDNYPNRLEFAKQKAKKLLQNIRGDEVALTAFADNAFLIAPFTADTVVLNDMIDGIVDTSMSSTNFTALGEAIAFLTKDKSNKAAVVISDGGEKDDLKDFENILNRNNIKLFVLLVGSKNGASVLDADNKPFILPNGKIAITKRNDMLGNIALQQNGAYEIASNDDKDIKELAGKLHNSSVIISRELFYYPLGISLIFLLLAWSSLPMRIKA